MLMIHWRSLADGNDAASSRFAAYPALHRLDEASAGTRCGSNPPSRRAARLCGSRPFPDSDGISGFQWKSNDEDRAFATQRREAQRMKRARGTARRGQSGAQAAVVGGAARRGRSGAARGPDRVRLRDRVLDAAARGGDGRTRHGHALPPPPRVARAAQTGLVAAEADPPRTRA